MSQKTPRYVGFPPALEITYVGSSSLEMGPDSRPKENSGTRATIAGPIRVSIPSVSFLAVTNHPEIWGTTIFHTLTLAVGTCTLLTLHACVPSKDRFPT
jgi:hypothetical protein